MMRRAADGSCPEAIWQTMFGDHYLGFTIKHGTDWVVLADDHGQVQPELVGQLVQLIFPRHLPVAFTYSAEQSGNPDRFGGGCVVVTDTAVTVHDARSIAQRQRNDAAPGH